MTQNEIALLVLLFFAAVVAHGLIRPRLRIGGKDLRKWKGGRKEHRSRHFMKLINEGFRVYDSYCTEAGGGFFCGYFKFSILAKKPLSDQDIYSLSKMSHCIEFQLKNTAATNCQYITFNGKDLYMLDTRTGKTSRVRGRENTVPISRETYNKAVDIYNHRAKGLDKIPRGTLIAGDGR